MDIKCETPRHCPGMSGLKAVQNAGLRSLAEYQAENLARESVDISASTVDVRTDCARKSGETMNFGNARAAE